MRISTSWLDAYHLYQTEDWMTVEKLIDQIRGLSPMSPEAWTGTNGHRLLQEPHLWPKKDGAYLVGKDKFHADDFDMLILRNGAFVSEVKMENEVTIDGESHTIVGKVDGAVGLTAKEFKFKMGKPADVEEYHHSRQWPTYLHFGGYDRMDYQVYSLKDHDGVWRVSSECLFSLWPYRGMEQDVLSWIGDFAYWAKGRDLSRVA